ncbi:hypothetical protein SRABI118_04765 [Massilia sp. Bi118]|uniref:nucleotidyl transferase AbiEii/AbiGii toxin family protein n=1 Tax=Massilia sp. Bi118 TaxID=2822346 RepID=UPI001D8D64CE|nr:nucleotidyl transferase AbiEii/AbiGii toxin family protein [Massilia sp. Bi118]CAH0310452.1 hypothetical protein SRABI118_04765 [Massilia sp. Bi118]
MKNVSDSVLAKLKTKAKQENVDYQQMLTRYGLERMLYRLSRSEHARSFLLKGAMLFNLWFDMPHRPTTDVDMLGFGTHGLDALANIFKDVCAVACEDGIVFDPGTVQAEEIRKDANYEGVRVTFLGLINRVRCPIQVDIGYGDAVTPQALEIDYPVLLADMPSPTLRAYPKDTVIAEKTEAIAKLAMANTRLKDYFDLWVLSQYVEFEGEVLHQAIAATFERRKTAITAELIGLSDDFASDGSKNSQWNAFTRKNKLNAPVLPEVIRQLKEFIVPVLSSVAEGQDFKMHWSEAGPWRTSE